MSVILTFLLGKCPVTERVKTAIKLIYFIAALFLFPEFITRSVAAVCMNVGVCGDQLAPRQNSSKWQISRSCVDRRNLLRTLF